MKDNSKLKLIVLGIFTVLSFIALIMFIVVVSMWNSLLAIQVITMFYIFLILFVLNAFVLCPILHFYLKHSLWRTISLLVSFPTFLGVFFGINEIWRTYKEKPNLCKDICEC